MSSLNNRLNLPTQTIPRYLPQKISRGKDRFQENRSIRNFRCSSKRVLSPEAPGAKISLFPSTIEPRGRGIDNASRFIGSFPVALRCRNITGRAGVPWQRAHVKEWFGYVAIISVPDRQVPNCRFKGRPVHPSPWVMNPVALARRRMGEGIRQRGGKK